MRYFGAVVFTYAHDAMLDLLGFLFCLLLSSIKSSALCYPQHELCMLLGFP
ncbi:hypothetical protein D3C85_1026550 [compost metagenome]